MNEELTKTELEKANRKFLKINLRVDLNKLERLYEIKKYILRENRLTEGIVADLYMKSKIGKITKKFCKTLELNQDELLFILNKEIELLENKIDEILGMSDK